MKTKFTLLLAVLACVAAGAAWLLFQKVPTTQQAETRALYVLDLDRDNIRSITISSEGTKLKLEKSGDAWNITEPIQAPADSLEMGLVLQELEYLRRHQKLGEKQLANVENAEDQFGFKTPLATVTIEGDGKPVELIIGGETPVTDRHYARVAGRNQVEVIEKTLLEVVRRTPDAFRNRRLVDLAPNEITRLVLSKGGSTVELVREDDRWNMIAPYPARADQEAINDLASTLATARVTDFSKIEPDKAGLTGETQTIVVSTTDGKAPTTITFGNDAPAPSTPADPNTPAEEPVPVVHARVGDGPVVTIPESIRDTALPDPEMFRDRRVVPFQEDLIDRIRLTTSDGSFQLERAETGWTLHGDTVAPANNAAVRRLLDSLAGLNAVEFLTDATGNAAEYGLDQPALRIELLAHSLEPTAEAPAGEHPIAVVRFGSEKDGIRAVRLESEPFIAGITDEAITAFIGGPEVFQDLQIMKFDPSTLTRIERTLDGAAVRVARDKGGWKLEEGNGVLDSAAMDSMAATLGNLRAVRWTGPLPDDGLAGTRVVITCHFTEGEPKVLNLAGPDPNGLIPGAVLDNGGVFLLSQPEAMPLVSPLLTAPEAPEAKRESGHDNEKSLSTGPLPATLPPVQENPTPIGSDDEVAVITTNKGVMVVEFWPDVAPATVENFKKLAKDGFYDGTAFHRIVKDFMIQGGDPLTKDKSKESMYGTGDPGYKIKAEFNERKHELGVLSMARAQDPNSAGSQFFICLAPAPFLDRQYTGFGKLIGGIDVLKAIGETPTSMSRGGERSKPNERIEVQSVKIMPRAQAPL